MTKPTAEDTGSTVEEGSRNKSVIWDKSIVENASVISEIMDQSTTYKYVPTDRKKNVFLTHVTITSKVAVLLATIKPVIISLTDKLSSG